MEPLGKHPFRTGCLIGLIIGAIRYPGALGCLLLILLVIAALIVAGTLMWFFDAMPWSGIVVAGIVAVVWWSLHAKRE